MISDDEGLGQKLETLAEFMRVMTTTQEVRLKAMEAAARMDAERAGHAADSAGLAMEILTKAIQILGAMVDERLTAIEAALKVDKRGEGAE